MRLFENKFLIWRSRFQNTYSGSAVSYRVIRLQELTSYTFRINASNEAGHGPFSQLYCFSTSKSPPSPPMKGEYVGSSTFTSFRNRIMWILITKISYEFRSYEFRINLKVPTHKESIILGTIFQVRQL